jgi:predicted amidohydrolase
LHLYLLQTNIIWRDKPANFNKIKELLNTQEISAQSLILLPEMFATGFDVEYGGVAEGEPSQPAESGRFLSELAMHYKCYVQGGVVTPSKQEGLRQNQIVTYNPQGVLCAVYTKLYPFSFGGEHKRFIAGRQPLVYQAYDFKVAPFICYDLRFPEVFRHALLNGAELITLPANWPASRANHFKILLQARAIENQCFVAGINRCGSDKFLNYAGGSCVFAPDGTLLAEADDQECVLHVEIDKSKLTERRESFPVLNDIRKEFLGL